MDYNKIIEAIERDIGLRIHFTDYDFGQILNIKCPRPENSSALREEYFSLMNGLKEFLKSRPTRDSISLFVLESVKKLDSSKYSMEEFKLLILKYNGFNHFGLGVRTVKEYFDRHKDELKYKFKVSWINYIYTRVSSQWRDIPTDKKALPDK